MMTLKLFARDWIPPAILRWVRKKRRDGIFFSEAYSSWAEAASHCKGYDAESILAKVLAATLKVKHGNAAFERDSVTFSEVDYDWPVLAGLMWTAAKNGGQLNVLDFGGALGSSYFKHRKFLQSLPATRWSVVEQAHYVKAGLDHVQDEHLRFYPSIDHCLSENQPNVILLSSVLQYLPSPYSILKELVKISADTILIDKTIVNCSSIDRIYVQNIPASIYSASYPCFSLSEARLMNFFEKIYEKCSDFDCLEFPSLDSIESKFQGYFLLKRK
jgi:putative methyltransferase (TIGR04325 family)